MNQAALMLPKLMADLNRVKTKKQKYSNSDDYSNWQLVGWGGIIAGILILSFYSVIAGWTMSYILKAGSGAFDLINLEGSKQIFANLVSDPEKLLAWHTIFMFINLLYSCSKESRVDLKRQ